MLSFITRRLALAVLTLWAISIVAFAIIQLPPGDYLSYYVSQVQASGASVSADQLRDLRAQFGLDQPGWVQYGKWLGRLLRGDFGRSLEWQRPVADLIGERLLLTMVLSVAALLLTWLLAFPIGIYSAARQYSPGDYAFTFLGFIGLGIPNFLLALVLMYAGFALFNSNVGGFFSPAYLDAPWSAARAWDLAKHLPLPAFVLAVGGIAATARIMRANLLDELRKPYVTTARAKGLREWRVLLGHPVRVALNPFISTLGYLFPYVVSGSVVVSLVMGLPTVGPLLLKALVAQDMFLAATIIMMLSALTVLGTLVSDLLLLWVDPRVREEG